MAVVLDLNYVKFTTRIAFFKTKRPTLMLELFYTGPVLLGFYLTGVVILTMVAGISENERDIFFQT